PQESLVPRSIHLRLSRNWASILSMCSKSSGGSKRTSEHCPRLCFLRISRFRTWRITSSASISRLWRSSLRRSCKQLLLQTRGGWKTQGMAFVSRNGLRRLLLAKQLLLRQDRYGYWSEKHFKSQT